MAGKLRISDFTTDNEFLYKSMQISTQGKKVKTPIRGFDLTKIRPSIPLNRERQGINEIHKTLFEKTRFYKTEKRIGKVRIHSIYELNSDNTLYEKENDKLYCLKNKKAKADEITMTFLEYVGSHYPNKEATELIVDWSYVYSDIVPFPIISLTKEIKSRDNFLLYKKFLREYYEIVDTLNKKVIVGIIPRIGRMYMDELLTFYYDRDITNFYFDCECKSPLRMQPNFKKFFRALKNEDLIEKSFIHATNIYSGRFLLSDEAINARDILSFGIGVDSMGRNMRKAPPPEVTKKAKESKRFRLFNKNDYGYHQLFPKGIKTIYPPDSNIPLNLFSTLDLGCKYILQNNFNMEQQALEAIKLRNLIGRETIEDYLKNKDHVNDEDIKDMKNIHASVFEKTKQKSLFDL